tara:strand:+ start:791 stop:1477 length:687 start_codon:yes stop_codon:yes gene_type:complete
MNEVLGVEDLWRIYSMGDSQVKALRGVSFSILEGEMVAITGPSGSGKTTLLNCISTLDAYDQGSVRFDGVDLSTMGEAERTRLRGREMGFIFQQYHLLPVLTAVENVELPLLLMGVEHKEARQRASGTLKLMGLETRLNHRPSELSGGQQQRVAIARAIVHEPRVLFADEPTGNLDSATSKSILAALDELNRAKGLTIILVTHDEEVSSRCGRILSLADGCLLRLEEE